MKDRVTDQDELIDQVLEGLRQVKAPAGLEGRVVLRLEGQRRRLTPRVWVGVAGAGLVTAALLIAVGLGRWDRVRRTDGRIVVAVPSRAPKADGDPGVVSGRVPAVRPVRLHRRSQGLSAILTPSFPAPEPPLSEEERLLARLGASEGEQALPVLDEDALDRHAAESRAAAARFSTRSD